VHVLQFRIFEDQCSGTDEPPGRLDVKGTFGRSHRARVDLAWTPRCSHYREALRAVGESKQEQLEADARRTWPKDKQEVQTGYMGEPKHIISLDSVRKNGGGGGVGKFAFIEDAENAQTSTIGLNWNVSGTREKDLRL